MNAPAMPISALIRISALALVAASQVTNANALILMRALMGIAGAFIFPISLAILPTIFSEQERPRAIAIGGGGFILDTPMLRLIPWVGLSPSPVCRCTSHTTTSFSPLLSFLHYYLYRYSSILCNLLL